ncbi:MAG TPA: glycosyltransferase [Chryseosolibacter sp.]|nr:glycosyltransferase [Chryseosolibacter sp.]
MMFSDSRRAQPLVSVIIPCFNQGRFLADAIASVQRQTYHHVEIVVVDDGSTDNTREVAVTSANVRYFYQPNAGLSAARNHGIAHSNGLYLVFLDADDVLFPHAIDINATLLSRNPSWAFVSGWHEKVDEWLYPLEEQDEPVIVDERHYLALLRGNYIGMHASVMYRRNTLEEFEFDTTLRACEDYDLYLKLSRRYPVGAHSKKIAGYRRHGQNMSQDFELMLSQVLKVHGRQRHHLQGSEEISAWKQGRATWKMYYATRLYRDLFLAIDGRPGWPSFGAMRILATVLPGRFRDYVLKKAAFNIRSGLKKLLPHYLLKTLHRAGAYRNYTPPPGKIQTGDFNRLTPFSADFGFDRGGAIDRFYIEKFLEDHRQHIRGHVLEIGDNAYTIRFGGQQVIQSDVLHIDSNNPQATYIGDITHIPQIPSDAFDCIIFTQTLHLIYDFRSALRTCYRILKPGGCLLLTVPGISRIDQGEWRAYWLWSFTDTSIRRLLNETFNGSQLHINTYGNVYVAAAFLYGMGLPEFRRECLLQTDPGFQVIISAAAVKA